MFKNPKPALLAALRESGPVPGDENGVKSKRGPAQEDSSKKRKKVDKNVGLSFLLVSLTAGVLFAAFERSLALLTLVYLLVGAAG